MNKELETCFQEYVKASNEALNWFIASWEVKGVDREMCLKEYKALKKKSKRYAKRLSVLAGENYEGRTNQEL